MVIVQFLIDGQRYLFGQKAPLEWILERLEVAGWPDAVVTFEGTHQTVTVVAPAGFLKMASVP